MTESFVLIHPSATPVASVVLFMGSRGALGLSRGPLGSRNTNFLVRTRQRFAERDLLVAVVDVPSDRTSQALVGFRTGAEHAADVKALIAALRADAGVPVWLVGTSMGSGSAASVAARLTDDGPDGIVLTSSVTRRKREMGESLQDVALDRIRVPVLLVHHRDDACPSSRYADTSWAMRRLGNAEEGAADVFRRRGTAIAAVRAARATRLLRYRGPRRRGDRGLDHRRQSVAAASRPRCERCAIVRHRRSRSPSLEARA